MTTTRLPDGTIEFRRPDGTLVGKWRGRRASDTEIHAAAVRAGWTGWRAVVATAIAIAESDGYTGALGDLDKTDATYGPSVGLWQIRILRRSGLTETIATQLLSDPATNAHEAHARWETRGWKPWGTFKTGKYLLRMTRARAAAKTNATKSAA